MAEASMEAITVETIGLVLDEDEAGYLLDLLLRHVGGSLAQDGGALGRIRVALTDANVERKAAHNATKAYAALYETEAEAAQNEPLAGLGLNLYRAFT